VWRGTLTYVCCNRFRSIHNCRYIRLEQYKFHVDRSYNTQGKPLKMYRSYTSVVNLRYGKWNESETNEIWKATLTYVYCNQFRSIHNRSYTRLEQYKSHVDRRNKSRCKPLKMYRCYTYTLWRKLWKKIVDYRVLHLNRVANKLVQTVIDHFGGRELFKVMERKETFLSSLSDSKRCRHQASWSEETQSQRKGALKSIKILLIKIYFYCMADKIRMSCRQFCSSRCG